MSLSFYLKIGSLFLVLPKRPIQPRDFFISSCTVARSKKSQPVYFWHFYSILDLYWMCLSEWLCSTSHQYNSKDKSAVNHVFVLAVCSLAGWHPKMPHGYQLTFFLLLYLKSALLSFRAGRLKSAYICRKTPKINKLVELSYMITLWCPLFTMVANSVIM